MASATIFEAKTNLSALIRKAQAGEKVVITSGREKTPVAELTALVVTKPRRLGFLKHLNLLPIPDSLWFDPLPEEWTGEVDLPGDPLVEPTDAPALGVAIPLPGARWSGDNGRLWITLSTRTR